ncbi:MAG: hypothetical protein K2O96_00935 [Lachnospiraceae bacterium]|uniref:hypothetical protein n=1 Tax=Mediterraneibacter agrestimuris TaxID=2941333 RepID=UPI00203EE5C0|nr:hypothetical protein [Mediterraneibacter agrestimuris]MDE6956655.1 hypothetical protein [Lachnospiraceae bacterium]
MSEILNTATKIAKVIRCDPQEVRHKMRTGKWKFGRVIRPGTKGGLYQYEATINEVAKYIDISREEAERRLAE